MLEPAPPHGRLMKDGDVRVSRHSHVDEIDTLGERVRIVGSFRHVLTFCTKPLHLSTCVDVSVQLDRNPYK
jgi:hypothetical protein